MEDGAFANGDLHRVLVVRFCIEGGGLPLDRVKISIGRKSKIRTIHRLKRKLPALSVPLFDANVRVYRRGFRAHFAHAIAAVIDNYILTIYPLLTLNLGTAKARPHEICPDIDFLHQVFFWLELSWHPPVVSPEKPCRFV